MNGQAPVLARSAARAARADAPGTGFEVVHLTAPANGQVAGPISPGVYPPLVWTHGMISEQLSMTLLGTGIALRTSFLPQGPGPTSPVELSEEPGPAERFRVEDQLESVRRRLAKILPGADVLEPLITRQRGLAQANPSFLFSSSRILEVILDHPVPSGADSDSLIPWWGGPGQLTTLLAGVTGLAAGMQAPILFLHSSLSIPHSTFDSPLQTLTLLTPRAQTGHVLRMGVGLPDSLAVRSTLLEELATLGQQSGYGLCVADRSPGVPRGLWRRVLDPTPVQLPPPPVFSQPMTLLTSVAPASVGVIHELIEIMRAAGIGILAIGAEIMQEAAFTSLLLATPGPPEHTSQSFPGARLLTSSPRITGRQALLEQFPAGAVDQTVHTDATQVGLAAGDDASLDTFHDTADAPDPLAEAQTMVTAAIGGAGVPVAAGGFVLWIGWEIIDRTGASATDRQTVLMPDAVQPAIEALRERCPDLLRTPDLQLTVAYARARRTSHREARGRLKVLVHHPMLVQLSPARVLELFTVWCREAQRTTRQNLLNLAVPQPEPRATPAIQPTLNVRVSWLEPWLGSPSGTDV
jgi:hypothetical protein